MTVQRLSENEAYVQMAVRARQLGIGFEVHENKIRAVLNAVYGDGVFLKSFVRVGDSSEVPAQGMSQLNADAATRFILAKCTQQGLPVFLIQKPITSVVQALYQTGLTFVAGPGRLMDQVTKGG